MYVLLISTRETPDNLRKFLFDHVSDILNSRTPSNVHILSWL